MREWQARSLEEAKCGRIDGGSGTFTRMDSSRLTTSERRILTLLYQRQPLSKRQLVDGARLGWATVVKMLDRLISYGLVESVGKEVSTGRRGKPPGIFGLSRIRPLAIGVDVEYRTITIALTDLHTEILAIETQPSPVTPNTARLQDFLVALVRSFVERHGVLPENLAGVGVGVPGIGLPDWANPWRSRRELASHLEERLGFPVATEVNVRAYTVFERWSKRSFPTHDFMLLSIRTGVGSGIIQNGQLFTGYQGFAGEIGHFKVAAKGAVCRCGARGCLETVANQYYLYGRYQREVLGKTPRRPASNDVLHAGLARLFSEAEAGLPAAARIIDETGHYLGRALAAAILILNLPTVVISGHFGTDGHVLLRSAEQEIRSGILPKVDFRLLYRPFDPQGFILGAALLVLRGYFTHVPEGGGDPSSKSVFQLA